MDKNKEETTFEKFKKALLELMRGYPEYAFFGKFEYFLQTRERAVDVLLAHDVIEEVPKKEIEKSTVKEEDKKYRWYRLRPRGVDMGIAMINLEHSEKLMENSKKMEKLTYWIIVLTIATIIVGIMGLIFDILSFVYK